eukprot:330874_1
MTTKNTFITLVTLHQCIKFVIGTIFLCMILLSKLKYKSRVTRIHTVVFYIAFYEFSALLDLINGIGDNYNLYATNGAFDYIIDIGRITGIVISHELFFILMIERAYYSFKNNEQISSISTIIILLFISIIIESLHFFVRIQMNYQIYMSIHKYLLITFLIASVLFGFYLMTIFMKKLFKNIIRSRTSLNFGVIIHSTPSVQLNEISKVPLNTDQTVLVKEITKNVILNVLAILFRDGTIILYVIESLSMHKLETKNDTTMYTVIPIIHAAYNVCLFWQMFTVYLSYEYFIYSLQCYDTLCGKIHFNVNKFAVKYTHKKLADLNMERLSAISKQVDGHADNEDEYQLMDDEL